MYRNDMQEDGSPLRQRVAELEGVIRQVHSSFAVLPINPD